MFASMLCAMGFLAVGCDSSEPSTPPKGETGGAMEKGKMDGGSMEKGKMEGGSMEKDKMDGGMMEKGKMESMPK